MHIMHEFKQLNFDVFAIQQRNQMLQSWLRKLCHQFDALKIKLTQMVFESDSNCFPRRLKWSLLLANLVSKHIYAFQYFIRDLFEVTEISLLADYDETSKFATISVHWLERVVQTFYIDPKWRIFEPCSIKYEYLLWLGMEAAQAGEVTCTCLLELPSTKIDDAVETRNLWAGYYWCFENIHIIVIYIGWSTYRWNCPTGLLLQVTLIMRDLFTLPSWHGLQFRQTMRVMYAVLVIMFMIY